jgi:hypothetical protein
LGFSSQKKPARVLALHTRTKTKPVRIDQQVSAALLSSLIIRCDSEISLKPDARFQRKNIFEPELIVARGI